MIGAANLALDALGDVPREVRERLLRWLRLSDSADLSTDVLGQFLVVGAAEAERIASALAEHGVFDRREVLVCVSEGCGVGLSEDSVVERRCRNCDADLDELEPVSEVRYVLERRRSHDVRWLIALHGIRTHGPWQEQLQWLIDREFHRTVPFRNWKYGRILFRALIPALQRRVVDRFCDDVRLATGELHGVLSGGPAPAPDVVAHSFGTWVVAQALRRDPNLRLGHVVLVGSIVPPDWSWADILDRNQVTAVLNYCGDRDPWVRLAERFVPDSGPSGTQGFAAEHDRLINVLRPGGLHSSAFTVSQLPTAFDDVWRPFLSDRPDDIDSSEHRLLGTAQWARAPLILRAPVPLIVGMAAFVGTVAVTTLVLD